MPYMTASSFLGLGKETTRGTAVAASVYLPCDSPQWDPKITWLADQGLRGSPVDLYGDVAGVRSDEYAVKGNVFLDTLPHLLLALLGGPDTKTGAGPYDHSIPLLRSASTGNQPPSYSLTDYDGTASARRIPGAMLDTLTLAFGVESAFTWDSKWIGAVAADVTPPTETFSTEVFVPAWSTAVTIGGVASSVVVDGTIECKRSTTPIHTNGQQGPHVVFAGPLAVAGKLTLVYEATTGPAALAAGLAATKQTLALVFTDPTSGHHSDFTMSQVQYEDPKVSRGKTYVELEVAYMAEANATDAVTGYSPITTVTTNSVSTAV